MTIYAPVILAVRMSDFGYWVVDVSVAPDKTVSIMIAEVGISPDQARELALSRLPTPGGSIPI